MSYTNVRPVPCGHLDDHSGLVEMRVDLIADTEDGPVTLASLPVDDCEIFEAEIRVALLRASRQQVDVTERQLAEMSGHVPAVFS